MHLKKAVEVTAEGINLHIDHQAKVTPELIMNLGEKLLEANANPYKYPDLVVRVTGFTAYFVSLSPEFRQLVVDRFLKGL